MLLAWAATSGVCSAEYQTVWGRQKKKTGHCCTDSVTTAGVMLTVHFMMKQTPIKHFLLSLGVLHKIEYQKCLKVLWVIAPC